MNVLQMEDWDPVSKTALTLLDHLSVTVKMDILYLLMLKAVMVSTLLQKILILQTFLIKMNLFFTSIEYALNKKYVCHNSKF